MCEAVTASLEQGVETLAVSAKGSSDGMALLPSVSLMSGGPAILGNVEISAVRTVKSIEGRFQDGKRALVFSLDPATGAVAVKVVDARRLEVVRRITPQQALRLVAGGLPSGGSAAMGRLDRP